VILLGTVASLLLSTGGAQQAADLKQEEYSAKVKVKTKRVTGGVGHGVRIQNKARTAEIVSVVVAGYEGFTDPPISVDPPPGWQSRVVQWQEKDKKRFAVVITCDPNAWVDGTPTGTGARPCLNDQGATISVGPQAEAEFEVVLPYESAGLLDGRVRVIFADGHVLETPSQRSRLVQFPNQPGRRR
jgi:hypothetical protein